MIKKSSTIKISNLTAFYMFMCYSFGLIILCSYIIF